MPPPANRLLAALPPGESARLTRVTFAVGQPAYHAGGLLNFVYFPVAGLMSAVAVMADGDAAEVAAVAPEGALGVAACVGAAVSPDDVVCEVGPCACLRLPAGEFAAEVASGGPLRAAVHAYLRGAMAASARLAACNALHGVPARSARWLLTCRDRVGADEFPLTHAWLADLLGVRRSSVTEAAGGFMAAGLIRSRSGRVEILDPAGLERAACECYAAVRDGSPGRAAADVTHRAAGSAVRATGGGTRAGRANR